MSLSKVRRSAELQEALEHALESGTVAIESAARPLAVGDVVDARYELRRDLGRGAAGVVFAAQNLFTGRRVALKILSPDLSRSQSEEIGMRMQREAKALAAVRHPGVVEILDGGLTEDGVPYIVMELLEGRTLEGILAATERLKPRDAIAITLQVASALAAVHAQGIVHRDLKPSNVIIAKDALGNDRAKIVDFGIAQMHDPSAAKLTGLGALIGTPEYMSPEQLLAFADVDERADVYALGVVLYECLAGRVPHAGSYQQVLIQIGAGTPAPNVRTHRPDVDPRVAVVLSKAIAKDRDARFNSMVEFAEALAKAAPGATDRLNVLALGKEPSPQSKPNPAPEQRAAPRAPYSTPIRVRLAGGGEIVSGRSENVSPTGMLAIMDGVVPKGRLNLRFALPLDGRMITCIAEPMWQRKSVSTGKVCAVGLRFVDLPAEVTAELRRYVDTLTAPTMWHPGEEPEGKTIIP